MRYLAIDLGDRRTGVALGDDIIGLVSPLRVVEEQDRPRLVSALAALVEEHGPDALVVGLPVNMDGSEGDRARLARAFADELAAVTGLPVHAQDERLSSFAAEQQLSQSGLTRGEKKARRDALAACAILRDFLDAKKAQRGRDA